jgi:hypothetical protein
MPFSIKVNWTTHSVGVDGDTPVLWVLDRHRIRLRCGAIWRLHHAFLRDPHRQHRQ